MTETEAPAELLEAMHKTYYRDLNFAIPEAMARVHDVVVAYYKAAAQAKLTALGEAYDAAPGVAEAAPPVTLTYTNWRGETAERTIIPLRPWFGATEWHPEPQWLLTAIDVEKGAERDFALKDFGQPVAPAAEITALRAEIAEKDAALDACGGLNAWRFWSDKANEVVKASAKMRAERDAAMDEITRLSDRILTTEGERDALAARLAVPGEEALDKAQRVASIYRFEDADGEIRLGDVIGALRARVAGLERALTVTDEMVERAAEAAWDAEAGGIYPSRWRIKWGGVPDHMRERKRAYTRAALTAALSPSAAQEARDA